MTGHSWDGGTGAAGHPSASYMANANEHLAFDADLAERVHDLMPVFTPVDIF